MTYGCKTIGAIKDASNKELENRIAMFQTEIDIRKKIIDDCIYELNNRGAKYKCLFLMPSGKAKFHLVSGYSNTQVLDNPFYKQEKNARWWEHAPEWKLVFTLIEVIDDIYVYEEGGGRGKVKYFNRR